MQVKQLIAILNQFNPETRIGVAPAHEILTWVNDILPEVCQTKDDTGEDMYVLTLNAETIHEEEPNLTGFGRNYGLLVHK